MYELVYQTPNEWAVQAVAQLDSFLLDHAACERKASGMALSLVAHYPDKPDLVRAMIDLAMEELAHFKEVTKWLHQRGIYQHMDTKDPYVNALKTQMGNGREAYFRDRLIIASIIEKRGHERFSMIAQILPEGGLQRFYQAISRSEARHYELFLELALQYCEAETVWARLDELLSTEAEIVAQLPHRSALH